jgi:hypothetical protein
MNPQFLPVPGTGMFINVALIHFIQFQDGKAIVDLGTNQITIEGDAVAGLRERFEPAPQLMPVPNEPAVAEVSASAEPENPTQPEA